MCVKEILNVGFDLLDNGVTVFIITVCVWALFII